LMYQQTVQVFRSIAKNILTTARTKGESEGRIFVRLILPFAIRPIISGIMLCFARAICEFGATLMVAFY
ncbi:ABC transporter permease subunit, partial [Staphylococcus sp. GDB8P47P]|uniref:ABC transporter permease subunit n=1 Tax=Staphylococcus sp. GDB8P47P TaxID=2804448 RepID=UPI00195450BF